MGKLAAAAVVALAVAFAPRPAEACGSWGMKDVERKLEVRWLINAGSIAGAKGRVAALYLDEHAEHGLRVVKERKIVFDVAGDKLRKRGKPVATFDAASVTFGKRTYTFELTDPRDWHSFPSWRLVVKRGDTVVIEAAQASALCAAAAMASKGTAMPDADQQAEIRRRVMYYLAWREVGA